jgi:hypothetical protein
MRASDDFLHDRSRFPQVRFPEDESATLLSVLLNGILDCHVTSENVVASYSHIFVPSGSLFLVGQNQSQRCDGHNPFK